MWKAWGGWRTARRTLPSTATVFQAETVGIELGLELLEAAVINPGEVTIWSDSQAAIYAFKSARPVDQLVRQAQDRWQRLREKGWRVEVRWVPGHLGVEGNEKVDEQAKRAAEEVAPPDDGALGVSVPPLVQKVRRQAEEKWASRFVKGRGRSLITLLGPTRKIDHPKRLHRGLSRAQSSLLTQLRTGHCRLNKYLARIRVNDHPGCDCGSPVESREHLFLSCSLFSQQRRALREQIGPLRAMSLRRMLNSEEQAVTKAALRFAASRFPCYSEMVSRSRWERTNQRA